MTSTTFNHGWTVRPKVSAFARLSAGSDEGQPITLPHDAIISLPRSAAAPSAGRSAFFPDGAFEYVKEITAPADWRTKRVTLQFDGVYRDSMVYVNGTFAGQRPSGYTPFRIPLDSYLNYGASNTIRVDARTHDDSRWYAGAGIYRDVHLLVTDLLHIDLAGPRVTTPDIDRERAVVEVATRVVNETVGTAHARVTSELRSPTGELVAKTASPITLRAGEDGVVRHRLYVQDPKLWSVDTPSLYTAHTELSAPSSSTLERRTATFGVRSVQLDPLHGLRINGEPVKLRGACIHHDNGPLGVATIRRAEERRIEILKDAGFNAVRSSHNPMSPAMLDACDRIGMLVMDETFDMWAEGKSSFDYSLNFPEWWERDVEALIEKDFNHPSVIFYSIGNEIFETGDPLGSEWGRKIAERVRELDSSRLVTNGINPFVSVLSEVAGTMASAGGDDGGVNSAMNAGDFMSQVSVSPLVTERTEASFSVLDVAGLNYSDARYEGEKELFPTRIVVGTETYPPRIAHNWALVAGNAHVLGDFTWTGWEYLGEVGAGRVRYADSPLEFEAPFPWISAHVGDIDITGHRRPISYYREIVFGVRRQPYIAVHRPENYGRTALPGMWAWSDSVSHWSWDVPDGTPVKVEVYSPGDEVELVLNGRSLGRRRPGSATAFLAEFDVVFERGTLEAVAYVDGLEQGRAVLQSAEGVQLTAVADREVVRADDSDLAYIAVELRDAKGNLSGGSRAEVSVTVEGPGELQAVGNAQPETLESYTSGSQTTFDARAIAIIRPTGAGVITVRVAAPGFAEATTRVEAVAVDA